MGKPSADAAHLLAGRSKSSAAVASSALASSPAATTGGKPEPRPNLARQHAATAPAGAHGNAPAGHRSKPTSLAAALASIPAWLPLSLAAGLVLLVGSGYLTRAAAAWYGRRRSSATAGVR